MIEEVITPSYSFETLSERYSDINETTGYYKGQEYFTEYFSQDFINNNIDLPFLLDSSGDRIQYRAFGKCIASLDINGDKNQDIVAVVNSFCTLHPDDYAYHPSKLIVILDYKNSSLKQVVDLNSFHVTKMEVNDFNSDGISDLMLFKHDTYKNFYIAQEDGGGLVNYPPGKPTIVYFDNIIKTVDVGIPGDSHYGTSGDVDNDGDIDFVYWPIPGQYNNSPTYTQPYVALNKGFFNFDYTPIDVDNSWFATSYDLFDINGDSKLDLIVGWRIGTPFFQEEYWYFHNSLTAPVILLGNGTGNYSYSNSIMLPETYLSSRNIGGSVLGFGFSDFDQDGDVDIITTSTRDEPEGTFSNGKYYDNYYLGLLENKDNAFLDSTDQVISGSFNNDYSFPNFYHVRTIDVDNDGDYDIIPDAIANWGPIQYRNDLKWINNSGKFIRN